MIDVSQIITFRKGRAFTTRQPEPPVVPAPPATPAVPSATLSLGGGSTDDPLTYAPHGLPAARVRIDTRPPGAAPEPEPAVVDPAPADEGNAPKPSAR